MTSNRRRPRPGPSVAGFGRQIRSEEMVINMGPQHPSTHGVLRLELIVDGEMVVDVIPHIGYLHRCFEKHCEHMTNYQQVDPVRRPDGLRGRDEQRVRLRHRRGEAAEASRCPSGWSTSGSSWRSSRGS